MIIPYKIKTVLSKIWTIIGTILMSLFIIETLFNQSFWPTCHPWCFKSPQLLLLPSMVTYLKDCNIGDPVLMPILGVLAFTNLTRRIAHTFSIVQLVSTQQRPFPTARGQLFHKLSKSSFSAFFSLMNVEEFFSVRCLVLCHALE
jgi:hypothetical protein